MTTLKQQLEAACDRMAEEYANKFCGRPNEQCNQLGVMMRAACEKDHKAGFSALSEQAEMLAVALEKYSDPGGPGSMYEKAGLHFLAKRTLAKFEAFLKEAKGE